MSEQNSKDIPAPQPIPLSEDVKSFLLAEYAALMAEILKRSETQHQLISLAVIATGTFLTFGLQNSITISLAYPIVSMFLAATWAQHDYRIRQIGAYIKERIESKFLGNNLGWEHTGPKRYIGRFGSLTVLASRGVFIGTQILAVVISAVRTTFPTEDIILLIVDVLLIILTLLILRRHKVNFEQPL